LRAQPFAEGSMAPKIEAACSFVETTGGSAVIGSVDELSELVEGGGGTTVTANAEGIELATAESEPTPIGAP
jgi:carbamate kinase